VKFAPNDGDEKRDDSVQPPRTSPSNPTSNITSLDRGIAALQRVTLRHCFSNSAEIKAGSTGASPSGYRARR
jgi:hypothetical protein